MGKSFCFVEKWTDEYSFGQEQIPIPAIQAITSGGQPGQAATSAGQSVSTLLAAANPCAKVYTPDVFPHLNTNLDSCNKPT